jgi:hypothetical protein
LGIEASRIFGGEGGDGGTCVTLYCTSNTCSGSVQRALYSHKVNVKSYNNFNVNLKVENQIQTIKLLGLSARETSLATVFIFPKFYLTKRSLEYNIIFLFSTQITR